MCKPLTDAIEIRLNPSRAEILAFLARAKIFAHHAREESQGIALCEALANGLPVVASNVGGIPYVITHGENGLLTPYGDIAAFATAMQKLLRQETLYATMANVARTSAERFDWATITPKIMKLYEAAATP